MQSADMKKHPHILILEALWLQN